MKKLRQYGKVSNDRQEAARETKKALRTLEMFAKTDQYAVLRSRVDHMKQQFTKIDKLIKKQYNSYLSEEEMEFLSTLHKFGFLIANRRPDRHYEVEYYVNRDKVLEEIVKHMESLGL